jgi:uncharacterized Tic20 family protein
MHGYSYDLLDRLYWIFEGLTFEIQEGLAVFDHVLYSTMLGIWLLKTKEEIDVDDQLKGRIPYKISVSVITVKGCTA